MTDIDMSYDSDTCELTVKAGNEAHRFTYQWDSRATPYDCRMYTPGCYPRIEAPTRFANVALSFFDTFIRRWHTWTPTTRRGWR